MLNVFLCFYVDSIFLELQLQIQYIKKNQIVTEVKTAHFGSLKYLQEIFFPIAEFR